MERLAHHRWRLASEDKARFFVAGNHRFDWITRSCSLDPIVLDPLACEPTVPVHRNATADTTAGTRLRANRPAVIGPLHQELDALGAHKHKAELLVEISGAIVWKHGKRNALLLRLRSRH